MSNALLSNLMHTAVAVTLADRAFACDPALNSIDSLRLTLDDLTPPLRARVQTALSSPQPLVGNTAVVDPMQAPRTNTAFGDLRGFVVLPVGALGVIYLDRPIKTGVIERVIVERLAQLIAMVFVQEAWTASEAELIALYERLG